MSKNEKMLLLTLAGAIIVLNMRRRPKKPLAQLARWCKIKARKFIFRLIF
jgi:hypothetical protein